MSGRLLEAFWINLEFSDFTKIKMKTYTWNSSVALLSPTCLTKFSTYPAVVTRVKYQTVLNEKYD